MCGRDAPDGWEDPIVAEVRKVREAIFAAYGFDTDAYWEHLGQVEREKREQGIRYVESPFAKRTTSAPDAA